MWAILVKGEGKAQERSTGKGKEKREGGREGLAKNGFFWCRRRRKEGRKGGNE